MQKPTSVRAMQFILYLKLIMFLMGVVSLIWNAKELEDMSSSNLTTMILYLTLTLLSMIGMLVLIQKKKYIPTIFATIVVLFFSMIVNQLQIILSLVLILLIALKSTRAYFRSGGAEQKAVKGQPVEVTDAEEAAGTDSVANKAAKKGSSASLQKPSLAKDGNTVSDVQPKSRSRKDPEVFIREATPEDADTIYSLMMIAFEEYRTAIPPSSALEETEESIVQALREKTESAAILYEDDTATAMVRFKIIDDAIYFFRLSVVPARRRRGYAKQLVKWIETHGISKGLNISRCKVRQSVQNNLTLYQDMSYEIVDQELVVRPNGTVKALTMEKNLGV